MNKTERFIAVFDMDGTLTPRDTIFGLFGLIGLRSRAERVYKASLSNPAWVSKEFGIPVKDVFPGIDIERVIKEALENAPISAQQFNRVAASPLYPGARPLIARLQRLGNVETFIATASYAPIAQRIAARLGVDASNVACTRLLLDTQGNAVKFVGPVMEGPKKADFIRQLAASKRVPLDNFIAVGDSPSDIPFLLAVQRAGGFAASVKDKAEIRRAGIPIFRKANRPDFQGLEKAMGQFMDSKQVNKA
ncbi:MAG: HAD-IB family phosphatase [Candidatus Micrarchaeota archaeon]